MRFTLFALLFESLNMIIFDQTILANLHALADVRKRMTRALNDLRFNSEMVDALALALSEAGANVIRHGIPAPSTIKIGLMANSRGIEMRIEDDGGEFLDFDKMYSLSSAMPDIMAEGGRGLALLRSHMDRVIYSSKSGSNRLSLFRCYLRTKLRVLLADDSDAVLAYLEAVLGEKFDIVKAVSAQELRSKLKQDIDLIITDLHLGDGTSSDLLSSLESGSSATDAPVILITSDRSDLVVREALRLGAETVLVKPISPKQLLEAIDKCVAARAKQRLNEARHFNFLIEDIVGKPNLKSVPGFNIAYAQQTASTGGGDLLLDLGGTDRRRIIIADLMGHGIKARARSATWLGLFRGIQVGLEASDPARFVEKFSRALYIANMPDHVTGTFLVIDLMPDGTIEMSSGGHPSPVIFTDESCHDVYIEGALPGLSEHIIATTVHIKLKSGERMFAATDGIDPDGLAYRLSMPQQLLKVITDTKCGAIDASMCQMADTMNLITGYRPDDDWTMLMIEPERLLPARS